MTQIGVTLHTFRNISQTLPETLQQVSAKEFEGVEFAHRIHDADIDETGAVLRETGLEPIAAHVSLSRLESEFNALIDRYESIDCDTLVIPHIPGDHFVSQKRVDALAQRLIGLSDRLASHGFSLVVHNTPAMHRSTVDAYNLHRFVDSRFVPTGGLLYCTWGLDDALPGNSQQYTGFNRLVTATENAPIRFEVDTQHAVAAGLDPHELFEQVSDRLFAVHLSDGVRNGRFLPRSRSTPLGEGSVDIDRGIRGAVEYGADWLVGEVDHPPDPQRSLHTIGDTVQRTLAYR